MPNTDKASTIDEVLKQLDAIIEDCIANDSRLGFFAYVYRRTIAEIANEIILGHFQDNERMETFDVEFANLYLDAFHNYREGLPVSKSWDFAFHSANEELTIIQHILFGMNAHINLDLSIATAKTMAGQPIKDIERDFNKVNDILKSITNELQDQLSKVSPLMFLVDLFGKNTDEKIIDFSMRKARTQAWNSAYLLWSLGEEHSEHSINKIDDFVYSLSNIIKNPKSIVFKLVLKIIQFFETKKVDKVITRLKSN
jgi:hypothetical protein